MTRDRGPDPTPAEIAALCEIERQGWSRKRAAEAEGRVPWEVPEMRGPRRQTIKPIEDIDANRLSSLA